MKHNIFKLQSLGSKPKIRRQDRAQDKIEETTTGNSNSLSESQQNFMYNDLVSMFKTFIQKTNGLLGAQQQTHSRPVDYEIQARNKEVIIDLPDNNEKMEGSELQKWFTEVINQVVSSSFYYYSNNQMSYQQAKVFCSQNILKNVALLNMRNKLSADQFRNLDSYFQNAILDYLMSKYPLTESQEINRNLQSLLKQIDNIEDLSNNYFFHTDIIFEYRQSANYNDLIMRMINDLMKRSDSRSLFQDNLTNFLDFKEFIQNIFEKVEDIDWMNEREGEDKKEKGSNDKGSLQQNEKMQNGQKMKGEVKQKTKKSKEETADDREKEKTRGIIKQKYKNSVKEYTHYLIGRKIPQNVSLYSQKQINNMHMVLKHPSILRILTKWCQQLLKKYTTLNYYLKNSSNVKLIKGGNVNNLELFMKIYLDNEIVKERHSVDNFMKDIHRNNYEMQAALLDLQLSLKGDHHINFLQKACGKYSAKIVNNLHSYIITYLNRLIHGLISVSYRFFKGHQLSKSAWPYPPNLLTFHIGDLFRCKFSSKEKQILKIYKLIEKISSENPNKLKLIRIKNRLRKGTNDILINVKFNNLTLSQIQLAVKSKTSDFIKFSNMYSHYFYELQRSLFGPFTELCSIWNSLDRRSNIFQGLIEKQKINKKSSFESKGMEMRSYQYPFVCSECNKAYYHNNFLKPHLRGALSNYWKCAKCQLEKQDHKNLVQDLVPNKELMSGCGERYTDTNQQFPEYGVAIYIETKIPKVEVFRLYESNKYKYLLGQQNQHIYEIAEITTKKQSQRFLNQYIVFSLDNKDNRFISIDDEKAKKQYILPKYVKECYSKQKENISLINEKLTNDQLSKILDGERRSKNIVKNMFLAGNQLTNIRQICDQFPNLKWLEINYNHSMKDYHKIDQLQKLQTLILDQCPLQTLPLEVCRLENLQVITISQSQIQHLPTEIDQWKMIRHIQIDFNQLLDIPDSFCKLTTIKNLNLNGNRLSALPTHFSDLVNIQKLFLGKNNFEQIPLSVFKLQKLKELYFHINGITKINKLFKEFTYLQILDLSQNKLTKTDFQFKSIVSLKALILDSTGLTQFPNLNACSNLQKMSLNDNSITIIPEAAIIGLNHLEIMRINNNQLEQIPFCISQLKKVTTLELNNNKLKKIDDWIGNLNDLLVLQAENNQITEISGSVGNCKKLQKMKMNRNRIQELPANLGRCSSMLFLQLDDNKIKTIPPQFSNFTNLVALQVNNNLVQQLPAGCEHLKGITIGIISMEKNGFSSILQLHANREISD